MVKRWNGRKTSVALSLTMLALMTALVAASVPLYRLFCQVTGYGGTTRVAVGADVPVLARTVRVRFSASTERDMPWQFKPAQRVVDIKLGERALAFYEAYNPTDQPITGQATYNVAPFEAGPYFVKIDCFCFTEQTLAPGQRVQMAVSYYVDPALADDHKLDDIDEITLHYTFFRRDAPMALAAAPAAR
ncbi:MAG: cytochrome c oxidase assembly protein [Alphaproteobacteria bacterium]|nr:MAG: cytochrome c oxidase assembly protein [Alphaproteobacteria bacterium]